MQRTVTETFDIEGSWWCRRCCCTKGLGFGTIHIDCRSFYVSFLLTFDNSLIFGLFIDAIGSPDCIASNDKMINGWLVGKNMEASIHGLMYDSIPAFFCRDWGKPWTHQSGKPLFNLRFEPGLSNMKLDC